MAYELGQCFLGVEAVVLADPIGGQALSLIDEYDEDFVSGDRRRDEGPEHHAQVGLPFLAGR